MKRILTLIVFFGILSFQFSLSSSLYWIGNSGNYDDPTHWSLSSGGNSCACIPSATDDVFFDQNSFSLANQAVTLANNSFSRNMDWTGVLNNPSLNGSAELHVSGDLKFASTMSLNFSGILYLESNLLGTRITSSGLIFKGIVAFNNPNGEWILQDDLTVENQIALVGGTFNTNNKNVKCEDFWSGNNNLRGLVLGSSIFTLDGNVNYGLPFYNSYNWNVNATNFNLNSGTSTIKCLSNSVNLITGNNLTYYNIEHLGNSNLVLTGTNVFNSITTTANINLNGSNQINELQVFAGGYIYGDNVFGKAILGDQSNAGNFSVSGNNIYDSLILCKGRNYTFSYNETQIVNKYLEANGTCTEPINVVSGYNSYVANIQMPAISVVIANNLLFRDINVSGGVNFSANNSIDLRNNSGINFVAPTPKTIYWVGGAGNWQDAAHWSASSGGSGGYCIPTKYDNVILDQNSFTDSLQKINVQSVYPAYCNNFSCTNSDKKPRLYLEGESLNIYGSLLLSSKFEIGTAYYGNYQVNFESNLTTNTIISNNSQVKASFNFNSAGEWTFVDDFNSTHFLVHSNGKLNLNNKTINCSNFYSSNTANRTLDITNTVFNLTSSYSSSSYSITPTNLSLIGSTSSTFNFVGTNGHNFYGGNFNYGDINALDSNSNLSISNNGSFRNIDFRGAGTISGLSSYKKVNVNKYINISGTNTIDSLLLNNLNYNGASYSAGSVISYAKINSDFTFNGTNEIDSLILNKGKKYVFGYNTINKINKYLEAVGSCIANISIKSGYDTYPATIQMPVGAVVDLDYISFKDIAVSGGINFTANNSTDISNNSGINFVAPTPKTIYWVGGTGNWQDPAHWSASSGGSGGYCIPTKYDNVVLDENSFTDSLQKINVQYAYPAYCNNFSCTNSDKKPRLYLESESLNIYGSLLMSEKFEIETAWYGAYVVKFHSLLTTNTITSNGAKVKAEFQFNSAGEWTFVDDFNSTHFLVHNYGKLNLSNRIINCSNFYSSNTANRTLDITNTVFNLTSSYSSSSYSITPTNLSLIGSTSSTFNFVGTNGHNFYGGNFHYRDINALDSNSNLSISNNGSFRNVDFRGAGTISGVSSYKKVNVNKYINISGTNTIDSLLLNNSNYNGTSYSAGSVISYAKINSDFNFNGTNEIDSLILHTGKKYVFGYSIINKINKYLEAVGSCTANISIKSGYDTYPATIQMPVSAFVDLDYVSFKDIAVSGGINFTANNSTDISNNSGINFVAPTPKTIYWVGGTGNWQDPAHWSASSGGSGGYCIPTKYDNVVLDENSFTDSLQKINVQYAYPAYCNNFSCTNSDKKPRLYLEGESLNIFGSLLMSNKFEIQTVSYSSYFVKFESTITTNTITSNGAKVKAEFHFNAAGEWTFVDDFYSTHGFIHRKGKVNFSNINLTISHLISEPNAVNSIDISNAVINLNATYSQYAWYLTNPNLSVIGGNSSIINVYNQNNITVNFNGGNFDYNEVFFKDNVDLLYDNSSISNNANFNRIVFENNGTLHGNNSIQLLEFKKDGLISNNNIIDSLIFAPSKNYVFQNGTTTTINDYWLNNGTCNDFTNISSNGSNSKINAGSPLFISFNDISNLEIISGTVTASNCNNLVNNIGFTLTSPSARNLYWVNGTGNWSDSYHWSLTSGGTGGECIPSSNDNVFFDQNSFPILGATVSINQQALCKNMDWTGALRNPLLSGNSDLLIYGSLNLIPEMQFNFNQTIYFKSPSAGNLINFAGISLANNIIFNDNNLAGSWTFEDEVVTTGSITLDGGDLSTNNQNVSCNSFVASSNGYQKSLNLGSSIFTIAIDYANWNLNVPNMTLNSGTSSIVFTGTGNISFTSTNQFYNSVVFRNTSSNGILYGTNNFYNVTFYGVGNISNRANIIRNCSFFSDATVNGSNYFDTLLLSEQRNYVFSHSDTMFIQTLIARGRNGLPLSIKSNVNTLESNFSISMGTICSNYLVLQDIHAINGASFFAGTNSIDNGNNDGWTFTSCFEPLLSKKDISCHGLNDGEISIEIEGGQAPYIIEWNSVVSTDLIRSNLAAGTYTITVTDNNLELSSKTITIIEPALLVANLTAINPTCNTNNGLINASISGGKIPYSLSWNNGAVSSNLQNLNEGFYELSVSDYNNCEVIVSENLTNIGDVYAISNPQTICQGSSYTINGNSYTLANTYTDVFQSVLGCDSIVTTILTVNNPTTASLTETACSSFTLNGETFTSSGVYTQNLTNVAGCDSTLTLNLTINTPTTASITETACSSFTLNGETFTSSGTYTQNLTNVAGCDSTLTLNLTINNSTTVSLTETACSSFTLNGETYTSSGTYTQNLTNVAGCDSTLTLNLTINNPTTSSLTETACSSFTLNGETFTSSGTYTQNLTNVAGCDSTLTLNLTINTPTTASLTETACSSFTLNGETFTSSGTYTQNLTNVAGCDSTLTLNLTINTPSSASITETACTSFTLNGETYTSSGTYTQNLTNVVGCDSTLTLNLTINTPTTASLTETACSNFTLNGETFTSSGTYTQNLTNVAGCDSTLTINLTISSPTTASITETACSSFTLNGETFTSSGTYTQNLTNVAGCDSTLTINLTIINSSLNTNVTISGNTLTAAENNATYQWVNCDNNFSFINGETNQDFTASTNGNYAVILNNISCGVIDTTNCFTINTIGIDNLATELGINIYPNPTNSLFKIESSSAKIESIRIFNLEGKLICEQLNLGVMAEFDAETWSEGVYWIEIETEKGLLHEKLLKK